jgi:hypothetical protein
MPNELDELIDALFTADADRALALARAWAAMLDQDGVGMRSEWRERVVVSPDRRRDD